MKYALTLTALTSAVLAAPSPSPQLGDLLSGLIGGSGGGSLLSGLLGGGSSSSGSDGRTGDAGISLGICSTNQVAPKDPLQQFRVGQVNWPCDFGTASIPNGPAPGGCADHEVIVARGTAEPGPFGAVVGDPVVARVKRDMPGSNVRGYAVQYPASLTGSSRGVTDVVNRITTKMRECPNMDFALVGYSQGGMVVIQAAGRLSAAQKQKVKAVALYGSGKTSTLPSDMRSKAVSNCGAADFACGSISLTGPGHLNYNDEGSRWHDRTAQFIADSFNGRSPRSQEFTSPT